MGLYARDLLQPAATNDPTLEFINTHIYVYTERSIAANRKGITASNSFRNSPSYAFFLTAVKIGLCFLSIRMRVIDRSIYELMLRSELGRSRCSIQSDRHVASPFSTLSLSFFTFSRRYYKSTFIIHEKQSVIPSYSIFSWRNSSSALFSPPFPHFANLELETYKSVVMNFDQAEICSNSQIHAKKKWKLPRNGEKIRILSN